MGQERALLALWMLQDLSWTSVEAVVTLVHLKTFNPQALIAESGETWHPA